MRQEETVIARSPDWSGRRSNLYVHKESGMLQRHQLFREIQGLDAQGGSHVVMSVNFIPCWTEAIGCAAIVKKVGAGINRFGFYFNKVIFTCVGRPAQTIVIA